MTDIMTINAAKILRGNLIGLLYRYYGIDIKIAVLRSSLRVKGHVDDEELKKAVYYLGGEGKRYIHVETAKTFADGLIWLTPAGVNLAEGDRDDIGVMIDNPPDAMTVTAAKILRGNLFGFLYKHYGKDINIAALRSSLRLKGPVDDEELKKAVYYLGGAEKEYIHVEPAKTFADGLIWLTPAGVNLAEGDVEDIGVIMDDE